MAPLLQDLRRIAQGVSLVALEAAKRSPSLEAARAGDVEAFVSRILKNSVVSVTDLTGLTRGRPHSVDPSAAAGPSGSTVTDGSPKESVVYFSDVSEASSFSQAPKILSLEEKPQPEKECSAPVEVHVPDQVVAAATAEHVHNGVSKELDDCERNKSVDKDVPAGLPPLEDATGVVGRSGGDVSVLAKRRRPRERRVPSTPLSRAIGFAGLGAGLAWGTIQESAKRVVFGMPKTDGKQSAISPFLSEQNAERLALALCRMRGAALKLGQMLSIQDESLVPAPILAALEIVRQGADVMPRNQLNDVLDAELGPDWRSKLRSFDYEPLAAASIGQVHRAVLKNGMDIAMKIQYPGVADSIESDIENVRRLLDYTNLIPKGLFLDSAIKVAKEELSHECDYELEAASQKRFRELLFESEGFYVPLVIDEVSCKKVLATELVAGVPIDKVALLTQETRDYVGKKLLELTLKELFVFRFMQTDPNWSNFLFDETSRMINLIDFGAAREYPKGFVDDYLRMVIACANNDRDSVIEMSRRLGFLTGEESDVMLDAHVQAGFIVGLPFAKGGSYDFRASNITQSISNLGATMLRHRLTPPPDEAYSLHRKLSGAFLACMKLGAVVPCRELLLQIYQQYQFGESDDAQLISNRA